MYAAVAVVVAAWATTAAYAQYSAVTCAAEPWANNTQGDNPCVVWAQLSSLCQPDGFVVPALHGAGTAYSPPNTTSDINECQCCVVAYRLMSACSLCQPGITSAQLFNETRWRQNCTTYNATGISIPHPLVDVPSWAFIPEQGATFDVAQASAFALSGASSFTATPSPSAGGTAGAAVTASLTNTTSTSLAHPKSSAGVIAGGVVGAFAVAALLIALAVFVIRRRTYLRSRPALSPSREVRQKAAQYGLPPDLHVQHFVPPPSSLGSYESPALHLSAPRLAVHPYAANYAVASNVPDPSPVSSIPSSTPYAYPRRLVRGYSRTGNVGSPVNNPSPYPRSVEGHLPSAGGAYTGAAAHPYANPMFRDDYDGPDDDEWSAPEPAAQPLPPLRVPQPVRHYSNGTDFEPSSLQSFGSSAPLVAASAPSSIERMMGRGGARPVQSQSLSHEWSIE